MSKAFTKEDDAPDPGTPRRLPSPLPAGAKNYITPEGAARLRQELDRLTDVERPAAASTGSAATGASASSTAHAAASSDRLQAIDARIEHLRRSLETAVVVAPPKGDVDVVRFGAVVDVRVQPDGERARYRIVGIDEADAERGWISWVSPIAKALLGKRAGDVALVTLPAGERVLELMSIGYEEPSSSR